MTIKMAHLVSLLGPGRKNSVDREELCKALGVRDRELRYLIADCRKENILILSNSKSSGYWLADNSNDIRQFVAENNNRIKNINEINKPFIKYLKVIEGQERID